MNHLILGGAGFIGQHLAHSLLNSKIRWTGVTVVDNLSTSKFDKEQYSQYKSLYRFIEGDLTTMPKKELLDIVRKHDKIWFLAGSVGVEHVDKNPYETLMNNVKLANNLVPFFKEARRHVIYTSTSEVYGEGPFVESESCHIGSSDKLRWGYASAKLTTEFMVRSCGVPYNVFRLFNVVGPGQSGDYGMVLPRFVEAAKANTDITIYGNGEQVRSFCHVKDACNLMIDSIEHQNQLFNIGINQPISINDLAKRVIELSGSSSKIVHVPYEQAFSNNHADINKRMPDISKVQSFTNFQYKHSLDDIIKDML